MLESRVFVLLYTDQERVIDDGIIGLSRSFIKSGVPSIVVSLWPLSDPPTAFFMNHALRQHSDKAWALRHAILATKQLHPDSLA
jgi:CHAT domain-containing protein